jgi:hypothetical protein
MMNNKNMKNRQFKWNYFHKQIDLVRSNQIIFHTSLDIDCLWLKLNNYETCLQIILNEKKKNIKIKNREYNIQITKSLYDFNFILSAKFKWYLNDIWYRWKFIWFLYVANSVQNEESIIFFIFAVKYLNQTVDFWLLEVQ